MPRLRDATHDAGARRSAPLPALLRAALAAASAVAIGLATPGPGPAARGGGGAGSASPAGAAQRLAETGLFVAGSTTEVRRENLAFSPQYPLWSDGTTKRRWLYLPPGTHIDARHPDAWEFPRGTRLWKEFSLDRRVETRLIERLADGSWRYSTYVWNDDGSDALLAPESGLRALPVAGAPNGRYAIPSHDDCRACHAGAAVPVLGVGALQLSPDRDPLAPHADAGDVDRTDLRSLVARGWLKGLPRELLETPPRIAASSPVERAALGYLHANCGHCHNDRGDGTSAVPVGVRLAQRVDPGAGDASLQVLASLLGAQTRYRAGSETPVVMPGHPERSLLAQRMRTRDPRAQMPPLGTRLPDADGLALIERWISSAGRSTDSAQTPP